MLPVPETYNDPKDAWYPPGHGDLFKSLHASGELDALIAQGREILFVSNGDNLGATVDLKILNHMIETGAEYIMELTDKTRADVKGGTLISYDGQVRLLKSPKFQRSTLMNSRTSENSPTSTPTICGST